MTLSTHVLDIARGVPASGIAVTLSRIDGALSTHVARAATNDDGRVAALGSELEPGVYELRFAVGAYFAMHDTASFYDEIPIRFTITDAPHYHVPLLLSPFGYSTYRGS